jgi:type IV secretion system protein VirB4
MAASAPRQPLTASRSAGRGFLRNAAVIAREQPAADRIPYAALVSDTVVRTRQGDYVFTMKLAGTSFETADDVELNQWHEQLNALLRNIASPGVALWTHVIRRRDRSERVGGLPPGFAADLDRRYAARLAEHRLMVNELYLSVVFRPRPGTVTAWVGRLLSRTDRNAADAVQTEALEACGKLQQQLMAALGRYLPRVLGIDASGPTLTSELLGFFGILVNGETQPMPLPRAPIGEVLATTRPYFGAEALEYRMPTRSRIGAMLGIKEYPHPSVPDMYHRLLTAPFPFVLTQSFAFLAKPTAQGLLLSQYNRMLNAGDLARSQAEELNDALDALTGNAFVMGDHHFTLQVLADPYEGVGHDDARPRLRELNDHVALAREILADTGMVVAREDLALEAGFWAQLPGNFAYRPRKAPITSRNFAAMSPLHSFPTGSAAGNHWGEALALLTTRANSPYFFSLHAPDLREGGAAFSSAPDVGHTFICGPTGSGKTVFLGFCVAMLGRLGASQVVFDKDRGLEILVRALGGAYLPLRTGEPTGFNPLRLAPTPSNVSFLRDLLHQLVAIPGRALSARQEQDLEQALRGALALEPEARRLSRVLEHLDATDPEGLHPRLARWCSVAGGENAWVFDGDEDRVVPMLNAASVIGFDVTEFLEHAAVRTPVTMYLFHLVRQMLDGRRFVCWCDEFWKLLGDPAFEAFSRDGPKTWRKLNGVFAASTQSASDVLTSPISRTLIEQTATKVFFPNPEARPEDYIDGFGLTEREFRLIREELVVGGRQFLVKQGHHSTVCRLDLAGFDAELEVISGRLANVERMHGLIDALGPEPSDWLSAFMDPAHPANVARADASASPVAPEAHVAPATPDTEAAR